MQPVHNLPQVSVVMPVYNAERHLETAVRSILNQTWKDLEFICVDDGSNDRSLQILQGLAHEDNRIKILSRTNRGIVDSLNDGIALARGEFVARMDADDVSLPHRLGQQLDYLNSHPEVLCVGSRALKIDSDGDPLGVWRVPLTHQEIDAHHIEKGSGGGMIHPAILARRQALIRAGGYAPKTDLAEDLDLLLRLAEIGRLANIENILLHYRVNAQGLSISRRAEQDFQTYRVVNAARHRRNLPDFQPPAEPWVPSEEHQLRMKILTARSEKFWRTARKYAWQLIRRRPSSKLGWLVLFQSLIYPTF